MRHLLPLAGMALIVPLLASCASQAAGGRAAAPARLQAACDEAAAASSAAGVTRAVALMALKNAFAARSERESELTAALSAEEGADGAPARKALAEAGLAVEEALDTVERINLCASRAHAAAEAAKDAARTEQATAAKDVERLARIAAKESARAAQLVEVLKRKWLIPATTNAAQSGGRAKGS